MDISFARWIPPDSLAGIYYLINIDKGRGLQCKFLFEVVKLSEEYHPIFYNQYDSIVVENKFLTANFFDFKNFAQTNVYKPIEGMGFTFIELKQFVEEGLTECILDFINFNKYKIIVLIPTRRGLSKLYGKIIRECEQEIGYIYNDFYEEQNIYVIES